MNTLELAMKANRSMGDPLPPVYNQLETIGAKIRKGQMTLVAAAPGGYKTALISNWAMNLDWTGSGDKVPGMYFSADSDSHTVGVRALAGLENIHLTEAEEKLAVGEGWDALREGAGHVWYCFDSAPSLKDVNDEIECYGYVNGEWPHWIVLDNLMNVAGNGDDASALGAAVDFGHQVSRETGAAVIFLHHVTGQYEAGDEPIPLSGLRFKVGKVPRLILTLHKIQENILGVSVVKNSSGPADARGTSVVTQIPMIPEKMFFGRGA